MGVGWGSGKRRGWGEEDVPSVSDVKGGVDGIDAFLAFGVVDSCHRIRNLS